MLNTATRIYANNSFSIIVGYMSEYPIKIEAEHKVIELTRDHLKVYLKHEVIEELKELTKNNEILHRAVLTLLRWAHYPLIPISDITDVSMEVIPTPPGKQELIKLIIKAKYYGGNRSYEFHLKPSHAQKIASEVKRLIAPQF